MLEFIRAPNLLVLLGSKSNVREIRELLDVIEAVDL